MHSSQDDRRAAAGGRPLAAACGALGIALALVLYRPWQHRPFDVLDFAAFLPLLQQHHGVGAQFAALVDYYANQHGRLNLLPYMFIALKWSLFGWRTELWQFARFLEMCAVVVLAYRLLRRLGATVGAAVPGACLFIVGATATGAWVRLTMAEPLGLLLILTAFLLACR